MSGGCILVEIEAALDEALHGIGAVAPALQGEKDLALGVRVVPAANSSYTERYVPDVDDQGRPCYRVQGTQDPLEMGEDDCSLLAQGYATVTLLGPDLTNAEATAAFKTDMNA